MSDTEVIVRAIRELTSAVYRLAALQDNCTTSASEMEADGEDPSVVDWLLNQAGVSK